MAAAHMHAPSTPAAAQIAACDGKTKYASASEARRVIQFARPRKARAHVYQCDHCGCWHIGMAAKKGLA